jgi:hypothetical protein
VARTRAQLLGVDGGLPVGEAFLLSVAALGVVAAVSGLDLLPSEEPLAVLLLDAELDSFEPVVAAGLSPYPSEYQPLPLRTKPAPPLTCRFAVCLPQAGQRFSGASLIDCSASQGCPQLVQRYSYVIAFGANLEGPRDLSTLETKSLIRIAGQERPYCPPHLTLKSA